MEIEMGYGNTVYGTVETSSQGLKYLGNIATLKDLIASLRNDTSQSDEDFLASLPKRLTGRVWARDTEEKNAS